MELGQFIECGRFTVQPLFQVKQLAAGICRRDNLIDLDQDMPRPRLLYRTLDSAGAGAGFHDAGAALAGKLQDVETVRAFNNIGYVALLQIGDRIDKQLRQAIGRAPSKIAAGQCIACVRVGRGDFRKVTAAAQLAQNIFRTATTLADLFRRCVFRNAHQNLREIEFLLSLCRICLGRKIIVDLGFRNLDLAVDFAFTYALHQNFIANLFPECRKGNAFALKLVSKLLHWHPVLLCNSRNRCIQHRIVDTHPHFLGELQLRTVHDHTFEQLPFQQIQRRYGDALGFHALLHALQALLQLIACDDFRVDHRNNRVRQSHLRLHGIGRHSSGNLRARFRQHTDCGV